MGPGQLWMLLLLSTGTNLLNNWAESVSAQQDEDSTAYRGDIFLTNSNSLDSISWQRQCDYSSIPAGYCQDMWRRFAQALFGSREPDLEKRASIRNEILPLCPQNMDRLECFERYMAFIVRFHPKLEAGLKRNRGSQSSGLLSRIFKRNVALSIPGHPSEDRNSVWNLCPSSWSKLECFTDYLTLLLTVRGTPTKTRRWPAGDPESRVKRAVGSLCPDWVDPVACFEGYFAYYINRGSDMKMVGRGSDNFIDESRRRPAVRSLVKSEPYPDGAGSGSRNDVLLCKINGSC